MKNLGGQSRYTTKPDIVFGSKMFYQTSVLLIYQFLFNVLLHVKYTNACRVV